MFISTNGYPGWRVHCLFNFKKNNPFGKLKIYSWCSIIDFTGKPMPCFETRKHLSRQGYESIKESADACNKEKNFDFGR